LRADLAAAKTEAWTPHYNERDYGGSWSGIALRSPGGRSDRLIAAPAGNPVFEDTPLLARCPYFREVLSAFQCPLKSVRLLSLAPGSFIREHSDHALGYDDGEIRIHVPIQTNPDVEFYLAGERLLLEEGHSYFLNVNLPHRVNNRGTSERIHLVIDAVVNEWVHALFRQGEQERWYVPRCPRPPRNVDDFRRHVLMAPQLMDQLQSVENKACFVEKAIELGRALNFDFHDGDMRAAWRCDPLPAALPSAPGWTPVRVSFPDGRPVAQWVYTGARRFTEPFFEDSVRVALRHPFARLFRIAAPLESARERDALDPSGLIFHVSRCGSTLISQMLAASPRHLMVSEAPAIDDVIQAEPAVEDVAGQVDWLRWVVRGLGERRTGETSLFIKLDAWHNRRFPLLRAAFPDTPCIFVCRDPVEVMVSQLSKPGRIAIQPAGAGHSREAWCARALEGIFSAALAIRSDPHCLFVDYRELPEAVFGKIARHFRLTLSEDDVARMRHAASLDAKNAPFAFQPDAADKQAKATPRIRELCEERLNALYAELSIQAANSPAT
jgi:hypothetical protein